MNPEGIRVIKELLETREYHDIGEKLYQYLDKEERNELWQQMTGFKLDLIQSKGGIQNDISRS